MLRVVLDTTVLVSAFLKAVPGGASFDLLTRAYRGDFGLYLSHDILEETERTLTTSRRIRARYQYPDNAVRLYCQALAVLAGAISDIPSLRVVRDPADDMIVAAAVAAKADYLVTRDDDLLSLKQYQKIAILTPESFLQVLRNPTAHIPK